MLLHIMLSGLATQEFTFAVDIRATARDPHLTIWDSGFLTHPQTDLTKVQPMVLCNTL